MVQIQHNQAITGPVAFGAGKFTFQGVEEHAPVAQFGQWIGNHQPAKLFFHVLPVGDVMQHEHPANRGTLRIAQPDQADLVMQFSALPQ